MDLSLADVLLVDFCDLFDLSGSPYDTMTDSNIGDDPLFRDPLYDNFRLLEESPCLEIGNSRILPYDEEDVDADAELGCVNCSTATGEYVPDLDHRTRVADVTYISDGPKDAENCLSECEKVVDIGAFEFACPMCEERGDLNGDEAVNGLDIQPFVDCVVAEDGMPLPLRRLRRSQ